jgi:teichuronic acid biosynthesis protein TuaE
MEEGRHFSLLQFILYLILTGGTFLIGLFVLQYPIQISIMVAFLPLGLFVLLHLLRDPHLSFLLLFVLNYSVIGIARYIIPGLMAGIFMDIAIAVVCAGLIVWSFNKKLPWDNVKNDLSLAVTLWFLFCILHVLNPIAPIEAWIIGIRRTALYFFVFPVLTFLIFNRYKDLKTVLLIWSVFVLLAFIKALMQKYLGFDAAEKKFLYIEGNAVTHIIYSGTRYFSFFTDAANFGCAMAFAMVFFSISALYMKSKRLMIYFIIISVIATFGMLMSGTRVAIAIPFTGYVLYVAVSKNIKVIAAGSILIVGVFLILNYTMIGQSYSYVRRMRTAFHPEKDASFVLRMENQKKMRAFLAERPFGVGIGTAKASEYSSEEISKIPTDSWLVMVWVETGITGLIFYICLILYIFAKMSYIVMFKIKNKELWGILCAFLAGIAGMFVASYANEVVAQFPNGPIIYMAMAFVFMAERFDQEIQNKIPEDGKAA